MKGDKMYRRDFIKLAGCTMGGVLFNKRLYANVEKKGKPNIVLIVADDLGYGDVGCFREQGEMSPQEKESGKRLPPIRTPHLDALAADGVKLTNFYSNCSVCSPTRAAIMTGRYQHRSGVVNILGQTGSAFASVYPEIDKPFQELSSDETTIADVFRSGGYRTASIGKWHISPFYKGQDEAAHPLDYGFDTFFGPSGNAGDKFAMEKGGVSYLWRDRNRIEASGRYFTYVVADEAIDFMLQDNEQPFFAYVPFTAPHPSARIAPRDKVGAVKWDEEGSYRTDYPQIHKELVEALDLAVGKIIQSCPPNTLIFFISDNGQNGYGYPPFNQHMGKQSLYEGGIRVPAIACWKGVIQEARRIEQPAMTMDLLPTFASIAGCSLPKGSKPLDGIDISQALIKGAKLPERMLFWEKPYQVWMKHFANRIWAMRSGKWKLLQSHTNRPLELYDLENDKSETDNVADKYPQIVRRLKQEFDKWKEDVYNDCPYDIDDFINRLRQEDIITTQSTDEEKDGY
jgi:arylsulfatase A